MTVLRRSQLRYAAGGSSLATVKPGRRPDLGERRTPGEYRPVTNRTVVFLGLGVVLLAALATAAILIASAGTKIRKPPATNLPRQTSSPHAAGEPLGARDGSRGFDTR
jgi:hypothetical protein